METIHRRFSSQFRSHWIKVKFYKEYPLLKNVKRLEGVRFCEATKKAILYPVLLDKESINCPGAQYAFGWVCSLEERNELLNCCQDKRRTQKSIVESMLSYIPHLKEPPKFIGLNTDGEPDLMMSYLVPEEVMNLLKIFHNRQGKNMDVSICSMMSVCGGVAVRTYLEERVSFSFGCDDSRKYAQIGRDRLAIGIPKKLFKIFVD